MTEQYWQNYKQETAYEFLNYDDPFWKTIKKQIQQNFTTPKHHLELYSICKSNNPYIMFINTNRQLKASPNLTIDTTAQLICRDKACQLQYCLSLQKFAAENRRRNIEQKYIIVCKDVKNNSI